MSFFALVPTLENLDYKKITGDITLTNKDYLIGCSHTTTIFVTLPSSSTSDNGKVFIIKDESGQAASGLNTITIRAPDGTNLEGNPAGSTTIENDYGCVAVYNNSSSGWFLLYKYAP